MTSDEKTAWQPRFYFACALSTLTIVAASAYVGGESWLSGFTVGFGAASVLALVFLGVQHAALRSPEGMEDV